MAAGVPRGDKNTRPCPYFNGTAGSCRKGDDCDWLHVETRRLEPSNLTEMGDPEWLEQASLALQQPMPGFQGFATQPASVPGAADAAGAGPIPQCLPVSAMATAGLPVPAVAAAAAGPSMPPPATRTPRSPRRDDHGGGARGDRSRSREGRDRFDRANPTEPGSDEDDGLFDYKSFSAGMD